MYYYGEKKEKRLKGKIINYLILCFLDLLKRIKIAKNLIILNSIIYNLFMKIIKIKIFITFFHLFCFL